MFTGTTIDELMALVKRAEQHTGEDGVRNLPPWIVRLPATPQTNVVYGQAFTFYTGLGVA